MRGLVRRMLRGSSEQLTSSDEALIAWARWLNDPSVRFTSPTTPRRERSMADEKIPPHPIPHLQPRLKARLAVKAWIEAHRDVTDNLPPVDPDKDIYVVWFAKTLQNWKALVSTVFPDGMYYECTYDGDKGVMYLDAYKKFDNRIFTDEDLGNLL